MLRTERLRFLFAPGSEDPSFVSMVSGELARLEAETQYRSRHEWTFRVYPSLDLFRNASGLGGDVAAAARGREIHLQPLATLRGQGNLRATVRHELAHALILDEAQRPLPEWLHEAMARWLSEGLDSFGTSRLPPCAGVNGFEDLERKTAGGYEARRTASRWRLPSAPGHPASRPADVLGWRATGFPATTALSLGCFVKRANSERNRSQTAVASASAAPKRRSMLAVAMGTPSIAGTQSTSLEGPKRQGRERPASPPSKRDCAGCEAHCAAKGGSAPGATLR